MHIHDLHPNDPSLPLPIPHTPGAHMQGLSKSEVLVRGLRFIYKNGTIIEVLTPTAANRRRAARLMVELDNKSSSSSSTESYDLVDPAVHKKYDGSELTQMFVPASGVVGLVRERRSAVQQEQVMEVGVRGSVCLSVYVCACVCVCMCLFPLQCTSRALSPARLAASPRARPPSPPLCAPLNPPFCTLTHTQTHTLKQSHFHTHTAAGC